MSSLSTLTNEKVDTNTLKREPTEKTSELHDDRLSTKKALIFKEEKVKRRKVAMLISYLGQGYLGLQR